MKQIGQIVSRAIPHAGQSNQLPAGLSKRGEAFLKRIPEGKQFLVQFNLDWCLNRYMHLKTVSDALYSDTIKLRELAQIYGEETVGLWIEAWLVNLSEFMDFTISEGQSMKTAMLILEEGYMLNLAEITLCFKRIMKLEFYGRFKASVIISEIKRYREERGKALTGLDSNEQKKIL